jgi:hypothetical protein
MQNDLDHHYIFIRLLDGEIFKVERVARAYLFPSEKPATIDVITQMWRPGCYFNFTGSHIQFPVPPKLICFLAACYSIRETNLRTGSSMNYAHESQFFCWAILSILTRSVASWHSAITRSLWAPVLYKALTATFWANTVGESVYDNFYKSIGVASVVLVEQGNSLRTIPVSSFHD